MPAKTTQQLDDLSNPYGYSERKRNKNSDLVNVMRFQLR